ncbi:hypothetical protein ACFWCB_21400 [Streptomyces sp. NPDC060048]|uniref:hypothetical protein n=1 Tax=unclassified Streptomyces TaxID=2593676 RepID=UPI0036C3CBEB
MNDAAQPSTGTTKARATGTPFTPWFREHHTPQAPGRPVPELLAGLKSAVADLDFPMEPASALPVVLPADLYAEMYEATRHIMALLRSALLERAPDGPGRVAALGAEEELYPLFVPGPAEERYATCMTRPDVVIDATGPKFLEFNIGGGIGGVIDTALISRAWTSAYGGTNAPFRGHDPLVVRDRMFAELIRRLGVRPAVAVVGSVRDLGGRATPRYYDLQIDSLRDHGLQAEFFEPEELADAVGRPGDLRFPVGLRHFTVLEWRELGIDLAPVRAALDAGCLMLSTQTAYLIANKKVMAWVSEGRPWMTDRDRRTVARYLPWTRVVGDSRTEWRGGDWSLPHLLLKEQENFVMKPAVGMKSKNILVGRDCAPERWRVAVEGALAAEDHIVQEYVQSVPYRMTFWDDAAEQLYDGDVFPVFGPYLFGGRPAGCRVRFLPPGPQGVVSINGHGAVPSVAFAAR